ncbi:tol-pal system protein YbgF [Aquisalimonas asiatica]|uniref:Cell division coordinator CpoB n=1 Tax=Aquisalimonas asiatica TaxID=406100 RepID=A0A1H8U056_9GAMM|nr:tol-pal system protein YbgF [Aquisalimonas asiatica]SEO96640.1 tol-pal system protein YbgF [Aquisalimonas asiatica]
MNRVPNMPTKRRSIFASCLSLLLAASLSAPGLASADDDLERRIERLERVLDSRALAELSNRQERLQREVSQLIGEIESLERQIEEVNRQQRNLFEDLDDRVLELEQSGVAGGTADTLPDTPALDAAVDDDDALMDDEAAAEAEDDTSDAAEIYSRAFDKLRDGDYAEAGDGFQEILDDHGDSDYADNARYWLAETHYVVREFDEAMEHFQTLIDNPDSGKHADAKLKAGYIHYEREEWSEARELLEAVRDEYPDSTVASLAGNRLEQMDDEGR